MVAAATSEPAVVAKVASPVSEQEATDTALAELAVELWPYPSTSRGSKVPARTWFANARLEKERDQLDLLLALSNSTSLQADSFEDAAPARNGEVAQHWNDSLNTALEEDWALVN